MTKIIIALEAMPTTEYTDKLWSAFVMPVTRSIDMNVNLWLCYSSPSYRKEVPGEGMPISGQPDKRGDLIIEFDINFPSKLVPFQKELIRRALTAHWVCDPKQREALRLRERPVLRGHVSERPHPSAGRNILYMLIV